MKGPDLPLKPTAPGKKVDQTCKQCGKPLKEGQVDFCSDECIIQADLKRSQAEKHETCVEMDKLDESAIEKELLGEPVEEYIYKIPFKNKQGGTTTVLGIGIVGINAIAQAYGGIQRRIAWIRAVYDGGRKFWECEAMAVDVITGNAIAERYRQPAIMRRGNDQDDPRGDFSFVVCQRKAMRNAVSQLIPQGVKVKLIESVKSGKALSRGAIDDLIGGLGGEKRRQVMLDMMLKAGKPIMLAGSAPVQEGSQPLDALPPPETEKAE